MPRNPGTGIYTKPFPNVVPDTTIESVVHNGEIADIELDLNTPRPVVAGGTGATSAAGARTNLQAEVAGAVVTNYDSHVFENGSFASTMGATGAPTAAEHFMGVAVLLNPTYMNLRVVGNATGKTYTRLKTGGVWAAWTAETDVLDGKVAKAGDTMTGQLTLNGAGIFVTGASPSLWTQASGTYNLKMTFPALHEWGLAITGGGNLSVDSITQAKSTLQFSANASFATIILPNVFNSAAAANMVLDAGNVVYKSTSSIRYKTDVKPLEKGDADKLLLLDPITYKSKSEVDDPNRTWFGFIAEEVAKVEPRLVTWGYLPEDWVDEHEADKSATRKVREGATKVPDGLAYDRISVLAVFKAKEQEVRLKAQEDTIAELTGKLDALMARIEALEAAQATP